MAHTDATTWDLEPLLPGGPAGEAFEAEYQHITTTLTALAVAAEALPAEPDPTAFAALLLAFEQLSPRIDQLFTFTACHAAADAQGKAALRAELRMSDLGAIYGRFWVVPNARLARMPEAGFVALLATPGIAHMRGMLEEKRRLGKLRLPEGEEALANELAKDGIAAWGSFYDVESGALKVTLDRGKGPETLSPGQAVIVLHHPDKAVRDGAFAAIQAAWRGIGGRCATALSHITGTRISLNDRRKLDELEDALAASRIERRTLEALVEAARGANPLIQRYFAAKARLLGLPALGWADVNAPVGEAAGSFRYDAAQEMVVDQFEVFSPAMAEFARRAFRERWIEVEDRPGKRGGGFCAEAPVLHQSRIFMTWGDTERSVGTLAHELGHAFHNEVLYRLPPSQRRLPMTLAETASTFGEALVREAARARVQGRAQRLALLDASLQDATAFLANIPARFELERALYRMRRQGPLEADALEAECKAIFSRWYQPGVVEVDATFWQSKLHFYIASISFYNFPYLFGFLFSALVYEFYRPLGAAGAPGYERLLARTGDDAAERIAKEELGLDLGDPATWARALAGVERDVADFEALVAG